MRLLAEYGADPLFEHNPGYWRGNRERGWTQVAEGRTTALMAAVGMGRGRGYPYRQPEDPEEQEALTLEAVKVAIEHGVALNVSNAAGRTALDGATALRFDSVVKFLTEKGAVAGVAAPATGAAPLK
jgi:ankyrin repeat protein